MESGTKAWANIQGATSVDFGIYFGKTKSDPTRKYRFTEKCCRNEKEAFAAVKAAPLREEIARARNTDPRRQKSFEAPKCAEAQNVQTVACPHKE